MKPRNENKDLHVTKPFKCDNILKFYLLVSDKICFFLQCFNAQIYTFRPLTLYYKSQNHTRVTVFINCVYALNKNTHAES